MISPLVEMMAENPMVALALGMFTVELQREGVLDQEAVTKIFVYAHKLANEAEAIMEEKRAGIERNTPNPNSN